MSSCKGDGDCIKQCWCECFTTNEQDEDNYDAICRCGHRDHNGYCPSNCVHQCQLVECHN